MIKIKIAKLGYFPFKFDCNKIENWNSGIFKILGDIKQVHFSNESDTEEWGYSDDLLSKELNKIEGSQIDVYITYAPLENNFYFRRIKENVVILSYSNMYETLTYNHIPIENLLLRMLYSVSLVFLMNDSKIPRSDELTKFTHDDTRGCLFDMDGIKSDVIFSLDSPILCPKCKVKAIDKKIADEVIKKIETEIKKIKRTKYFKISDFVKKRPVLTILLTIIFGIIIDVLGASIYDALRDTGSKSKERCNYHHQNDTLKIQPFDTIQSAD